MRNIVSKIMLSNRFLRQKQLLLVLFLLAWVGNSCLAGAKAKGDSLRGANHFGIGFYAGANASLVSGSAMAVGPSFAISGTYFINPHWQIGIGFGGIFYEGKSLPFQESTDVFDTIVIKKSTITGIAYLAVPITVSYWLGKRVGFSAGLRWLGAAAVYGNGTYGYIRNDSFICKSALQPELPKGASFMDVQGLVGINWKPTSCLELRALLALGTLPILTNSKPTLVGNHNNSVEIGLCYMLRPR